MKPTNACIIFSAVIFKIVSPYQTNWMPVNHRVTPNIKFAGPHLYTWAERGTVRVKCLAQEHNAMTPARAGKRTAWSGEECTNHGVIVPPEKTYFIWYLIFHKETFEGLAGYKNTNVMFMFDDSLLRRNSVRVWIIFNLVFNQFQVYYLNNSWQDSFSKHEWYYDQIFTRPWFFIPWKSKNVIYRLQISALVPGIFKLRKIWKWDYWWRHTLSPILYQV